MFFPLFALVFIATLTAGLRGGASRAVAIGWVGAAFLLPFWLQVGVGSMFLDLRSGAVAAVLVITLTNPPAGIFRLTFADALIGGVILVQVVTQFQTGTLRPLSVPEVCRKWLGPYLMGRLLITKPSDLRIAVGGLSRIIAGLSVYAVIEAFTKVNVINKVLGRTFDLLEEGEGYRWGLKRSHATFDHPIYFGMALVLLLPWAMEAARLARQGVGEKWWRRLPWMIAAALFATVSRGPQIAGMATATIYLFCRIPRIRVPMLLIGLVGGVGGYIVKEQLVDGLAMMAGEKGGDAAPTYIQIEGEEVEYTGTNHRVLLFRVYDEAIQKAGAFGYGPDLHGIELEESIAQRFGSIDCHYLLFYLQNGYLGLGGFLILTLGILLNLGRVAFRRNLPQSALAAGLFGSLLAVAVLLMSVWFSADFGGIWLFSAGVAGRLPLLVVEAPADSPTTAATTTTPPTQPPAPTPAHAPVRPQAPVIKYVRQLTPVARR